MKRRTKKQIAMDNAKAAIKAAGWKNDSNEAKVLTDAVNKQFEVTKGGSPELKEARGKRNEAAAMLKKINKMVKAIKEARQTLENELTKHNANDIFKRFNALNKQIVAFGGKAITLELDYITDLISSPEDDSTSFTAEGNKEDPVTIPILVAEEEKSEESQEEKSPFGV